MRLDFEKGSFGYPDIELSEDCTEDRAVGVSDGGEFPFVVQEVLEGLNEAEGIQ